MMTWMLSNLATILITVALIAVVGLIICGMLRDKRKGKCSCGCGCQSCSMGGACHSKR